MNMQNLNWRTIARLAISATFFSALAMPVLIQAKQSENDALSRFSNLKQLGKAFQSYLKDYDETYPLAFGQNQFGQWQFNREILFPADWPVSEPKTQDRIETSRVSWPTAILPYTKSELDYSIQEVETIDSETIASYKNGRREAQPLPGVGFTYNGLLHSSKAPEIASSKDCPVLWDGLGEINVRGAARPNPSLSCLEPNQPCLYLKSTSPCSSKNGGTSVMFLQKTRLSDINPGFCYLEADGHLQFLKAGAVEGKTNRRTDPYATYNNKNPELIHTDGCHIWLFRPDYDHVK